MRAAVFLLFALLTTSLGFAEPWTQRGLDWTCESGITLRFPADYKVHDGQLDSLSVDGKDCQLTVVPAYGSNLRKQGIDGILGFFKTKHVALEEKWDTRNSGKASVKIRRGTYVDGTVRGQSWIGVVDKGKAHLILMLLLPETIAPELNEKLEAIFKSAH